MLPLPRRSLVFLALLVLAASACVAAHRPPAARGAGLPVIGVESNKDDGPFRTIFMGPHGDSPNAAEVTIAYSRPVHALGVIANDAPTAAMLPASVVRAHDGAKVAGSWLWFGDNTAVFQPTGGFPAATIYRVEPNQVMRALDGSVIAPVETFTFTTSRPRLVRVVYGYVEAMDRHELQLTFNQNLDRAAVQAAIRIEGKTAAGVHKIGYEIVADPSARRVTLQADTAIVRLSDVAVIASPTLKSIEGPLTSDEETRLAVEEVGPLRVELTCQEPKAAAAAASPSRPPASASAPKRCPHDDVALSFSKGVNAKELARHLVVTSPLKKPEPPADEELRSLDLGSVLDLGPARKYRVTIKAGLRAVDKDKLTADRVLDFETVDIPPSLTWRDITHPDVVAESARPVIPIHVNTMNVSGFEALRAPLDDAQLIQFLYGGSTKAQGPAWVAALPGSASDQVTLRHARNAGGPARFDIPRTMRAPNASGFFAVATRGSTSDEAHVISVTDLGVTSKWSPHGGLVWVTRLSTSAAVANANVSVRRVWRPAKSGVAESSEVFSTSTDANGIANIPSQVAATFLRPSVAQGTSTAPKNEAILFVRHESDRTFARLGDIDSRNAFATGYIFAERSLYRPGETIFAKAFFRFPSGSGLVTLPGKQVTIEATDQEGRVFASVNGTLDAFGSIAATMQIPKAARLGVGSLRARVGTPPSRPNRVDYESERWAASARFAIDEFRTVEFKVDAAVDHPSYVRGQSAQLTAKGTYLTGAPMSGVPVTVQVRRRETHWAPRGLEEFSTDTSGLTDRRGETRVLDAEVKLGTNGAVTMPIPFGAALDSTTATDEITFGVSIDDVSLAFASGGSTTAILHPSDVYLGVRTPKEEQRAIAGGVMRPEIVAAGIDGARRAGVAVHVELLRHPQPGKPALPTGRTCDVVTSSTVVVRCDLPLANDGSHWIRATAVDASGRNIASATSFDVAPKGTPALPPAPTTPKKVEPPPPTRSFEEACAAARTAHTGALVADRSDQAFTVGETARVCVRSHGEDARSKTNPGLFTLEREGVLRHDPLSLNAVGAGTIVSIPLLPNLYPNVVASLSEVSGRTSAFPPEKRTDWGRPTAHESLLLLKVNTPQKALAVTIETAKEYRPGAEVEARVTVRDNNGRAALAQVTFWAVDEGILLLRPYQVPDPLPTFADERFSDVLDSDTRSKILWEQYDVHSTKAPSLRQGATSVSPGEVFGRSVFRPTAWFLPTLMTGADGVVTVKAKLPDNLTTWKLFAVASTTTDAFGSAQSELRTAKKLMARPQLPRFMRAGDLVEATAVIDSLATEPLEVKVSMRAAGAIIGRQNSTTTMTVSVPAQGHVPIRFPVEAREIGRGSVAFRVEAPSLVDDVTIEQEVRPATMIETMMVAGETKGRVDEMLSANLSSSSVRADAGGFDFRLSTSPLVGLAESLTSLIEYPYGCTEQLTSRLVPLMRVRGMARDLGVAMPRDVDGAVRDALATLASHQRSDGGFGFWRTSKKSEPWVTILALSTLQTASATGYAAAVPSRSIEEATKYVEQEAKGNRLDPASRALLEDVLVSLGRPREKELRALAALADKPETNGKGETTELPTFARALVAHALAKIDRDLARRLLDSASNSQMRLSGALATVTDESSLSARDQLSSDARTTAMVLRAWLAIDPKHPLVAKLVRGLLSMRIDGRWPTTQASAWALVALDDARSLYAPSTSGPSSAQLTLDGKVMGSGRFTGSPRGETSEGSIAMKYLLGAKTGASLTFESLGGGMLFYEGALHYARRDPPKSGLDHGFHIARTMRPFTKDMSAGLYDDNVVRTAPSATFKVGDHVVVDVIVTSNVPRSLVVLDDPIPSGFEAVNDRFANTDRRPLVADPSRTIVTHRELRDDRVLTFFDALPAGAHVTRYVLRVTSPGRFIVPPSKVECMYAPDVFARTGTTWVDASSAN